MNDQKFSFCAESSCETYAAWNKPIFSFVKDDSFYTHVIFLFHIKHNFIVHIKHNFIVGIVGNIIKYIFITDDRTNRCCRHCLCEPTYSGSDKISLKL